MSENTLPRIEQEEVVKSAGDVLLTVADAARVLRCDRANITAAIYTKHLPAYIVPGTRFPRVWLSDLRGWLERA